MALKDRINQDFKAAMKSKESLRVSCLRMLKTAVKNKQVEIGRELEDPEIESVLSSLVRKARESVVEYEKGGRDDLATKEKAELDIFMQYLPEQLSSDEIEEVVKEIIEELSAKGRKDMGKVMKAAMARLGGKAQGKEVSNITGALLGGL